MFGYVYLTTNLVTNKIYIRQHKSSTFDTSYYGSGKYLLNSIRKHGIENFKCELIEWCKDSKTLDEREIYYIEKYNSRNLEIGYNITRGGNGTSGYVFTDDVKRRISITSTFNNLNRDPEIYRRTSETAKGNKMMNKDGICVRVHPEEFEKYLSEGWVFGGLKRNTNRSEKNNPMYGKSAVKGRKWIHKGDDRRYVYETELDAYLADGWLFGMK